MDVHAVGHRHHRPCPADEPERARPVELGDVAGAVPAVGRERRGSRNRIVPVAGKDRGSADNGLAVGLDSELDGRQSPAHDTRGTAVSEVAGHQAGLGRTVPLDDLDAQRLPVALQ